MENTAKVTLTLSQEELRIIHTAIIEHRCKVGNLINQLSGVGLPTDDARTLSNRLGELSYKLCDLMTE